MSERDLIARTVPETSRMRFLPFLFPGRSMIAGEATVYAMARLLDRTYTGGLWDFVALHEITPTASLQVGGYMRPRTWAEKIALVSPNGAEHTVTRDTAGIVITLFALSNMSFDYMDNERLADALGDHYHALRDFAAQRNEREAIFDLID